MELKVENLTKRYGGRTVLDGVSFTLRQGVTCLMAPSGAGKTTLLRLLLGLERPDGGQITGLAGRRISAVFQEDRLLPGLDAEGNLRFVLGADYDAGRAAGLRGGLGRTSLVLAGLAVSGILTAGVNTMRLLFPEGVTGADGFLIGGLSGGSLTAVGSALPYLAAGGVLALFLAPELNILALGEQTAASLGLPVGRTRLASILAAALLAGAAVSFAGLISFVGLLVPHIARRLVGVDHRVLLPACALLGAIFLLVCDTAARTLFAPYELPVGILLNVIGGVFFLYLLLGRKRGRVYD